MDTKAPPTTNHHLNVLRPLHPDITNLPEFKPYYLHAPFSYICVTIYTFKSSNRDTRNLDVKKFLLMPETDKFAVINLTLTDNTYFVTIGYSLPQPWECPTARIIWMYHNNETLIDCNDKSKMPITFAKNFCNLILLPKKRGDQSPIKLCVFQCKPENLKELFDYQHGERIPETCHSQNNLVPISGITTFDQSILQRLNYIYNGGQTHKKAYLELIKLGYAVKIAPIDLTPAAPSPDSKRFKIMQNKAEKVITNYTVQNLLRANCQEITELEDTSTGINNNQFPDALKQLINQMIKLYHELYDDKVALVGLISVMLLSPTISTLIYLAVKIAVCIIILTTVIVLLGSGYLNFKFIVHKFEPFEGGRNMVINITTTGKKMTEKL